MGGGELGKRQARAVALIAQLLNHRLGELHLVALAILRADPRELGTSGVDIAVLERQTRQHRERFTVGGFGRELLRCGGLRSSAVATVQQILKCGHERRMPETRRSSNHGVWIQLNQPETVFQPELTAFFAPFTAEEAALPTALSADLPTATAFSPIFW